MIDSAYIPIILLTVLLILFIWDRWRYDLVAVFGLICSVALGIVPIEVAFQGFGHPAVVLVAAALIISAGLKSSGALQAVMGSLPVEGRSLWLQLLVTCGVTAALSAFINNVAAVALMIPFVVKLAHNSKRSARLYLMPLAFASLLGGLTTLIGTPPNIIIAAYRARALGKEPFTMFDFTPVGATLCLIGIIFISLCSRFFIKVSETSEDTLLKEKRDFLTELQVTDKSPLLGITMRELLDKYPDCNLLGIKRNSRVFEMPSQFEILKSGDYLIVEAVSEVIEMLISKEGLALLGKDRSLEVLADEDGMIGEFIVPAEAFAVGRSSKDLDLRWKFSVNVLGIARTGKRITRQLSDVIYRVGDIVLLQGKKSNIAKAAENMSWVFLSERSTLFQNKREIFRPVLIFIVAIAGSFLGYFDITLAFVSSALLFVLLGYVRLHELYDKIEWPVIVLLACLIPIGEGMEAAGSLKIVSNSILSMAVGLGPIYILAIVMTFTVLLTNVINNAAAAIVMAPVAIELAKQLKASPDALLMAVVVATSTAFMTPIAHQSNALVMEPGGYKFKEYFYLGFPLTLLILLFALPCLLFFWPL